MAAGKHAKGQCARCGFVYKLIQLIEDGDTNLLVCNDCYDIPHPSEQPFDATDDPSLERPAPDSFVIAPGAPAAASPELVPTSLAASLGLTSGTYFGGGT